MSTAVARGTTKAYQARACILQGVQCSAGSTLVVFLGRDLELVRTPSWNGLPFTLLGSRAGTAKALDCWVIYNTPACTASVVADFGPGAKSIAAMTATEITDADETPLDVFNSAKGNDTDPHVGASDLPASDDEVYLGAVMTEGPSTDTAGTWGNSFTLDQRVGTTSGAADVTVEDASKVVALSGSCLASKSGITSRPWVAMVVTFKDLIGTRATVRPVTRAKTIMAEVVASLLNHAQTYPSLWAVAPGLVAYGVDARQREQKRPLLVCEVQDATIETDTTVGLRANAVAHVYGLVKDVTDPLGAINDLAEDVIRALCNDVQLGGALRDGYILPDSFTLENDADASTGEATMDVQFKVSYLWDVTT